MTTAPRIVISEHSVRAALADWHALHVARPEPQRAMAYEQTDTSTSSEYAQNHAAFFFKLLEKHSEVT